MVVPLSLHADTRLHRTLLSRLITTFSTPHVPQYKYLQIIEQKYKSKEIFTRISTFIFIKTFFIPLPKTVKAAKHRKEPSCF